MVSLSARLCSLAFADRPNSARAAGRFRRPAKSPAKVAPYHGTPLCFHSQACFFFPIRPIWFGISAAMRRFPSHDSVYKQHFELRLNRQAREKGEGFA
jgi:hypothetical protein